MFGRRKVYVYTRPSAGEIFGSLMAFLVIAGIILALAAYVSWIILFVFLGIGGAIGIGYALFIYVRAFVSSVRSLSGFTPRSSGVLSGLAEKMFAVSANTAATAFSDNLAVASGAVTRSQSHRLISFRKWMWLVTALTIVVFGLCLIAGIILAEFTIVLAIALIVMALLAAICVLYLLVAIFYSLFFTGKFLVAGIGDNISFSCFSFHLYTIFADVGRAFIDSYSSLGRAILCLWNESLQFVKDNIQTALSMPLLSIKKWLYLVSPLTVVLWAVVLMAIAATVLSLVFFIIWFAMLLWTCMAKFISIFH